MSSVPIIKSNKRLASNGLVSTRLVRVELAGKRLASTSDVPAEFFRKLKPAPESRHANSAPKTSEPGVGRTLDPAVICHELDSQGIVHVTSGKFQKSSLCSTLGLLPRDIRKLDGTLKDQLPIILVRDSAVLVNMEHIRAIIKHDGVILFECLELEQRLKQHDFLLHLQNRLKQEEPSTTQMPFEFTVLETILQRTMYDLQEEFDFMQPEVEDHLSALENIVHWERLKVLLVCKKRVALFNERVNNIRHCLKELLESDSDMADMYLSEKHAAKTHDRPAYQHEEMELLLESYLQMAEEIASRTQILISHMTSTEDIINIALVGQRNELVLLDLRLGIGTFAASIGGFGASVLGMNLHTGYEQSPYAFWMVVGTLVSVASTSFVLVWRRMLRLIHRK
ncbi:Magnesium transporter MRS2/LPE10 domain-containing protein [Paramicrosporidium saccamoebae]|uniref:Magnesium transporter n=1 Tax=Paramicrosporidium saccamoebae TaxID=1246581 RepID=A0A2H9TFX6_9FUNG|nr:Magnesium transporter MRS2/LPE10 domain-containing protein [Paramicrosporidium saccamoebae]